MTAESLQPSQDFATTTLDAPEVLEERLSLVASAQESALQLGVFTDEELAALDDLSTSPVVPSPWFETLDDGQKQIALTAGLRGLTARGVYHAEPVDAASKTFTAHLESTIAALLTMRRFVPHLVVAERATSEFTDWAVAYPQRGETFLLEFVDRRGIHAFRLAGLDASLDALAEWVGRFDAAKPDLDVELTRAQIEAQPSVLQPVADALVTTTVTRFDPESPGEVDWMMLYTGSDGSYAGLPCGDAMRYVGTDPGGIGDQLRNVLVER